MFSGYRQGINNLRIEANRLNEQVDALAEAVNDLQEEADLMRGLEEQLSTIARRQGVNVNEIVMLVRENEEILSKQKVSDDLLYFVYSNLFHTMNCITTLSFLNITGQSKSEFSTLNIFYMSV